MFTLVPMEPPGLPVEPVQKAFEQVANQLRDLVVQGVLNPGDRLPNELELAQRFGVSRGTVREALRTLASEGLVVTTRGASGGSFAAMPDAAALVGSATRALSLMVTDRQITVEELLETREMLEVPAARLAALKRTNEDLAAMRASIPGVDPGHSVVPPTGAILEFHELVLASAGNRLLQLTMEPILVALHHRRRTPLERPGLWERVRLDHQAILAAIEREDGEAAAQAMSDHLSNIRPRYHDGTEIPPPYGP
jgi:GntR family transcriptional repressor for pyruvate dehydrogenase complex